MDTKRKYGGLRAVGWLAQILAWVILAASIAFAVWSLLRGSQYWFGSFNLTPLLALPIGIYGFFQFFVLGSLLNLMADLEYNTRANTEALRQVFRAADVARVEPPPPPPPPPPAAPPSS